MTCKKEPSRYQVRIDELKQRQYGLVTYEQARALGAPEQHLRRGPGTKWVRVKQGIYRDPSFPRSWHQKVMAAVLAGGPGALASHRSAATLHGLHEAARCPVEITVDRSRHPTCYPGAIVHRRARIERIDRDRIDRIPTTTVTRTVIDLSAVASADRLEAALEAALRSGRTSVRFLEERLAVLGGRGCTGTAVLREVLRRHGQQPPTESDLETKFLQLLRNANLPLGVAQWPVYIAGRLVARVDRAFPEQRVLVELDGRGSHGTWSDWQRDLRRQDELVLALPGWLLLRFTWNDVTGRPGWVLATVERALSSANVPGTPAGTGKGSA